MARQHVVRVYRTVDPDACRRDFAYIRQVRRSALSIPANIAEGFERDGKKELVQFLSVAKGSCGELRSHLHLGRDLGYLTESQYVELVRASMLISRQLFGFIDYLRRCGARGRKFGPF